MRSIQIWRASNEALCCFRCKGALGNLNLKMEVNTKVQQSRVSMRGSSGCTAHPEFRIEADHVLLFMRMPA